MICASITIVVYKYYKTQCFERNSATWLLKSIQLGSLKNDLCLYFFFLNETIVAFNQFITCFK
jgi:hypothetical protein